MPSIAFFDFDGTLTTKDSLKLFLSEISGNKIKFGYQYYLRCLFVLTKMYFGKASAQEVKEKRLSIILKSYSDAQIEQFASDFAKVTLPIILREKGLERILFHKQKGHEVALVSASIDLILKPWCAQHEIGLITNQLCRDAVTKKITFLEIDCNGEMKVIRIKRTYNLMAYDHIYAYGDTSGDKQMLAISHEQFYRPFED